MSKQDTSSTALNFWEGMFGNSMNVSAPNGTYVTYKDFVKRFDEVIEQESLKERRRTAMAVSGAFRTLLATKIDLKHGHLSKDEVLHWMKHIDGELQSGANNISKPAAQLNQLEKGDK